MRHVLSQLREGRLRASDFKAVIRTINEGLPESYRHDSYVDSGRIDEDIDDILNPYNDSSASAAVSRLNEFLDRTKIHLFKPTHHERRQPKPFGPSGFMRKFGEW